MLIKNVLQLLKEYNSSGTNTTLAATGGKKAKGKNFDNIIAGKSAPYKATDYETKYAKIFPALAELVKKVKSQSIKGDIMVTGPALVELQNLLKAYNPRQTPEGDYSLPFGDNVRMKQRNNVIYIGFNEVNGLHSNTPPVTEEPASSAAITK